MVQNCVKVDVSNINQYNKERVKTFCLKGITFTLFFFNIYFRGEQFTFIILISDYLLIWYLFFRLYTGFCTCSDEDSLSFNDNMLNIWYLSLIFICLGWIHYPYAFWNLFAVIYWALIDYYFLFFTWCM